MIRLKPSFPEKSVGTVLIALAGPLLIWGLHFAVVYSAHHLTCTLLPGHSAAFWARLAVIAATVMALLALLLFIAKPHAVLRMNRAGATPEIPLAFLAGVMRLLALLSWFGVFWAGSAAFFLPACESIV